jgi:protein-S-isoprenylcysteine O-methyltransferase Ste14
MRKFIRQGFSFILPITVLIIVPFSIEQEITIKNLPAFLIGFLIMLVGLTLIAKTVSALTRIGDGTLAPWSPTKKLVTIGIYGFVRNPMILGVLTVLIGESISILSTQIFNWAIIFFIINNIWFFLYEEPNLEKKFGDEYREYKKEVPRWIPRFHAR